MATCYRVRVWCRPLNLCDLRHFACNGNMHPKRRSGNCGYVIIKAPFELSICQAYSLSPVSIYEIDVFKTRICENVDECT